VAARKATAKSDSIETSSSLIIFYLLDHNITFWISMLISLSLYMSRPSLLQIMQSSTKRTHLVGTRKSLSNRKQRNSLQIT